jgi:DNA end-binding protein Ku
MARPIWSGAISFGLLNIPVQLMPAERQVDLKFHLLDSRDKGRIRYERVNADTGEEVPWKEVVKAYEYEKGSFVVLSEEDIAKAAPESKESVDIEAFVDPRQISPKYFEKPYYLVPAKKAEKGYVLLRDTLAASGKAGLARVVIRTREYLALVLPEDEALVLLLLRFPQELIPAEDYAFPASGTRRFKLAPREREMAEQLVASMTAKWSPDQYQDEFRARLRKAVQARIKQKGSRRKIPQKPQEELPDNASTNVVDFMALLKKSLAENRRTPARRHPPSAKPRSRKRG